MKTHTPLKSLGDAFMCDARSDLYSEQGSSGGGACATCLHVSYIFLFVTPPLLVARPDLLPPFQLLKIPVYGWLVMAVICWTINQIAMLERVSGCCTSACSCCAVLCCVLSSAIAAYSSGALLCSTVDQSIPCNACLMPVKPLNELLLQSTRCTRASP